MNARVVRVLPLGVIHPARACALCGTRHGDLRERTIVTTRSRGLVCVDLVGCVRRARELTWWTRRAAA